MAEISQYGLLKQPCFVPLSMYLRRVKRREAPVGENEGGKVLPYQAKKYQLKQEDCTSSLGCLYHNFYLPEIPHISQLVLIMI